MSQLSSPSDVPAAIRPRRSHASTRAQFLKWLRKIHGWVGLWGAVLGLLFGATGFLQNHRGVLRIATPAPVRSTIQLDLPSTPPQTPQALASWVSDALKLPKVQPRIQREPAQLVSWGAQGVRQPEHWELRYTLPRYSVVAEYWKGANAIKVSRVDHGWLNVVQNLHRGNGVGIAWILLADSIAGAMILLSITGVILWSELNRRRMVGFSIFAASIIALLVVVGMSL